MIKVLEFIPAGKAPCIGKLKILINEQQIIEGISVCENERSKWVNFPSVKKIIDGKEVWVPAVSYQVPSVQKRFCEEILKAYKDYLMEGK